MKKRIEEMMLKYNRRVDLVEKLEKRIAELESITKHRDKMLNLDIKEAAQNGLSIALIEIDETYNLQYLDSFDDWSKLKPLSDFIDSYINLVSAIIERKMKAIEEMLK